jgi:Gpi18-like mannosyltransferase
MENSLENPLEDQIASHQQIISQTDEQEIINKISSEYRINEAGDIDNNNLNELKAQKPKFSIIKALKENDVMFYVIFITLMAILLRFYLFEFISSDYKVFISYWYDHLKNSGGLGGIGLEIGDYTPSYIYVLAFFTYLPIKKIYAIKLVSVFADIILAVFCYKVVDLKYKKSFASILCYSVILFMPTVFFNSALWAQCDAIFVSAIIACLYYLLKNRPFAASIAVSIAFVFKLQTIFFIPVLIVLLLKGKYKIKYFLTIPAIYILSILPAWLMGRNIFNLLTVYMNQTGLYKEKLSMNAPNIYSWINDGFSKLLNTPGVVFAAGITFIAIFVFYKSKVEITNKIIIGYSMFFALLMPFILPHMHERYFYIADIISIIYAFYYSKRFFVPILQILISFITYGIYLFGINVIPLPLLAFGEIFILTIIAYDMFNEMYLGNTKENVLIERNAT